MKQLTEDKFVSNLIGYKSYIIKKNFLAKNIKNLRRPFFLTYKSSKKKNLKLKTKGLHIKLLSRLVYFERKYITKQTLKISCRKTKKKDLGQLLKIAKENNLNSRFILDKFIPDDFKKNYRSEWVKNFFKKKRGDYLLVATSKTKILGFVLIIKKKNILVIDLIVTSKKYRKKKVATSLINYINNKIMKPTYRLSAGTQKNNLAAIKMYKRLGFIKKRIETFCYHIHGR